MPLAFSGGNLKSTSRKGTVGRDTARFTGGGAAANCTKVVGDNILSVNYNAATGKYLVTFADVRGVIRSANVQVHPVAAGANVLARLIFSSYSASAKTIQLECYTDAGIAVDLLTTAHLTLDIEWGGT